MFFARISVKNKHNRKLIKALEEHGLEVSITPGKQHVKVRNPKTQKIVFFGAHSSGDWRAVKNILRDLKQVGFNQDIDIS